MQSLHPVRYAAAPHFSYRSLLLLCVGGCACVCTCETDRWIGSQVQALHPVPSLPCVAGERTDQVCTAHCVCRTLLEEEIRQIVAEEDNSKMMAVPALEAPDLPPPPVV